MSENKENVRPRTTRNSPENDKPERKKNKYSITSFTPLTAPTSARNSPERKPFKIDGSF